VWKLLRGLFLWKLAILLALVLGVQAWAQGVVSQVAVADPGAATMIGALGFLQSLAGALVGGAFAAAAAWGATRQKLVDQDRRIDENKAHIQRTEQECRTAIRSVHERIDDHLTVHARSGR
jgi:hypothetical protein